MFSLKILPFHIIFNRNHVIQEEPGVEGAMEVTGQVPESSTADGGYQSAGTQEYAEGKGIEPVFPKGGSWRVDDEVDGKKHRCYFTDENVASSMRRRVFEAIPKAKRWLRNNVEATIFQLTFHTRNNKTRYRGLMRQNIFAISRCLWVNCVRLSLFELRMSK